MTLPPHNVLICFGSGIPDEVQGEVMLAMEKDLRRRGLDALVMKDRMADDSKLRRMMTLEERAKL